MSLLNIYIIININIIVILILSTADVSDRTFCRVMACSFSKLYWKLAMFYYIDLTMCRNPTINLHRKGNNLQCHLQCRSTPNAGANCSQCLSSFVAEHLWRLIMDPHSTIHCSSRCNAEHLENYQYPRLVISRSFYSPANPSWIRTPQTMLAGKLCRCGEASKSVQRWTFVLIIPIAMPGWWWLAVGLLWSFIKNDMWVKRCPALLHFSQRTSLRPGLCK